MYKSVQIERLYEQIVDQVEKSILGGELKPGDKLPAERELAEQFNVSRTAIREAVKTLTQKGLIEVRPGRGTFVTNSTSSVVRHSIGLLVKIESARSTLDLVEVREILEPEIAAMAASRANEDHLAALKKAVALMDTAKDDTDTFIDGDMDFHLALAEGSQNVLILVLIDTLVDLLQDQRKRISLVPGGIDRAQEHHQAVLQAVLNRDPDAAREAMRVHLQQIRKDYETSLTLES
jgi:GntR family transcriptional regulator, transcriptional repressor for pyruvate dehydrogenase complex